MKIYSWIVRLQIIAAVALLGLVVVGAGSDFPLPQSLKLMMVGLSVLLLVLFFIGASVAPDDSPGVNRRQQISTVYLARANGVILLAPGLLAIGARLIPCSSGLGLLCQTFRLLSGGMSFGEGDLVGGLLLSGFGAFLLFVGFPNAPR